MLVTQKERIMATGVNIYADVNAEQEEFARKAIGSCMGWFREVEERLTRFVASSDLSCLNAANGKWARVSPMLFEVIELSVQAANVTEGLFDPTLLPILKALGYDRDYAEIEHREAAIEWRVSHQSEGQASWRDIEINSQKQLVRLPRGVELDLGGIVKGWAADVALNRFFNDIPNVIIDLGGDMRVRGGSAESNPWAIGIGNVHAGDETKHIAVLTLGAGGLATSGASHRWWLRAGERQHHVIDPHTKRPANIWIDHTDDNQELYPLIVTATALASTAAHAEVAAKVALLRGFPRALEAVEAAWKTNNGSSVTPYDDNGVALLLALGTGKVVCSTNMQDYLATIGAGGQLWLD